MDPDALLERIIDLACDIVSSDEPEDPTAQALAEGILDLHNWIEAQKGFLPKRWQR